jgi:citrate lyase beta subunit
MVLMFDSVRSLLFAPGDHPRRLARALVARADAVVADLEDAVVGDAKESAREIVASAFAEPSGSARLVRVNAGGTELERDLEAIALLRLDGVVLPKATPESVSALGPDGPPILAIVETATGVALSGEIARADRVAALILGSADLAASLGLEPLGGTELLYARSKLVVDCAHAGIRPPFDSAFLWLEDSGGLEREARVARALGMRGKICIHPDQVPIVNEVFGEELDVEWARATIAAYESSGGKGVVAHNGEMVDLAVVRRARRILSEAQGGQ